MDAEFERRWRNSLPPFDGLTVTLQDYLPLPLYRQVLFAIVERLYAYSADASLFRLLDWYEHDGFVKEAQPPSRQELRSLIASEGSLIDCFREGDSYVREGFFPAGRDY